MKGSETENWFSTTEIRFANKTLEPSFGTHSMSFELLIEPEGGTLVGSGLF